jgi:predicted nuclease of predicted toxin-antitoxin system
LAAAGPWGRHGGDLGLGQARDWEILAEADSNRETILTHDLDSGNRLAFSGEKVPSLIICRRRHSHPARLLKRLLTTWPEMAPSLQEGAMVGLEDAVLRGRPWPLTTKA